MTDDLFALVDSYEVGRIHRDRKGKLAFIYNEDWREDPNAYPISLSMPLATKEHGHEKIDSFLWACCRITNASWRVGRADFTCRRVAHSS
jgi:serine/threonine-protein kinase HipA